MRYLANDTRMPTLQPGRQAVLALLLVFLPVARPMLSRVWAFWARTGQLEQMLTSALADGRRALPADLCASLVQPRQSALQVEELTAPCIVPTGPLVNALADAIWLWRERGEWPWAQLAVPDMTELDPSPAARYGGLTAKVQAASTPSEIGAVLDALGVWGTLSLLRCRRTAGSVAVAPPDVATLVAAFCAPHAVSKGGSQCSSTLSVGARALSKHWHRGESCFWGECAGNDAAKNAHARDVLTRRILREAIWLNVHLLPGSEAVLEVRQAEGYGARWSGDGTAFRGFIEPHAWDVARRAAEAETNKTTNPQAAAGGAQHEGLSPAQSMYARASQQPGPVPASARDRAIRVRVISIYIYIYLSISTYSMYLYLYLSVLSFHVYVNTFIHESRPPCAVWQASAESMSGSPTGAHVLDLTGRALFPDGRVHIVGYGSLVDQAWARLDTPSLADYRLGWLRGYARCFNLVSLVNLRRGDAAGRCMASCTAVAR